MKKIIIAALLLAASFAAQAQSRLSCRSRSLKAVYAFVWLDAVHRRLAPFKVRQDGKVVSKAASNVPAIDLQGKKDPLGIFTGDAESPCFWLSVPKDLQNRGENDLLICSIATARAARAAQDAGG